MNFAAALSQHPVPTEAVGDVAGQVLDRFGGPGCDLLVVFATAAHTGAFDDMTRALGELLEPKTMIGGTAVSVAGTGREVEEQHALTVLAARLPDARLTPVALDVLEQDGGVRLTGWPTADAANAASLLLFADPFTFPVDGFLRNLGTSAPRLQVIGGLASAAAAPGGNRLVVDATRAEVDLATFGTGPMPLGAGPMPLGAGPMPLGAGRVRSRGAVGVLFDSGPEIRTLVSQGCRPVGQPYVITRSDRNFIQELGGEAPLQRLRSLATASAPEDRELLGRGLHLGLVVDEHRAEFGRGDFLIRNVIGADESTGAVAVGGEVHVGQTVQFQVRDAGSADEDLRELLAGTDGAEGALLFTCNGRGRHLFGTADHDAGVIEQLLGPLPLAGAFCAGEIGPVGGRNFLHGFTASVALFGTEADGATSG